MGSVSSSLEEIADLAARACTRNGRDSPDTEALVRTVVNAERDGSLGSATALMVELLAAGARLPGSRRYRNRLSVSPRQIDVKLVDRIRAFCA
jgi:hypothetical protein